MPLKGLRHFAKSGLRNSRGADLAFLSGGLTTASGGAALFSAHSEPSVVELRVPRQPPGHTPARHRVRAVANPVQPPSHFTAIKPL